ncbi:50S ribosomal protein L14 [Candidatus Dojkabacteria bacterium]|nr:50S ribosomal protein L14 [Candidatus Dojkabacteria bacterium]
MIQKGSRLTVADNTGAKIAEVIGNYGGSARRYSSLGDIVMVSIKKSNPGGTVEAHGKHRAVIVRTTKETRRSDGSRIRFDDNAAVILDGTTKQPKGTRVFGPVAREVKNKGFDKISSLAPEVP